MYLSWISVHNNDLLMYKWTSESASNLRQYTINARRACAQGVITVLTLCVCVCVKSLLPSFQVFTANMTYQLVFLSFKFCQFQCEAFFDEKELFSRLFHSFLSIWTAPYSTCGLVRSRARSRRGHRVFYLEHILVPSICSVHVLDYVLM